MANPRSRHSSRSATEALASTNTPRAVWCVVAARVNLARGTVEVMILGGGTSKRIARISARNVKREIRQGKCLPCWSIAVVKVVPER